MEPSGSFEVRAQSLVTIRSLMVKENLTKLEETFEKTAVAETVTYKLIDRLAAVLADRYRRH